MPIHLDDALIYCEAVSTKGTSAYFPTIRVLELMDQTLYTTKALRGLLKLK